jgi:thiol-disulfide isomerase/thioredoxin
VTSLRTTLVSVLAFAALGSTFGVGRAIAGTDARSILASHSLKSLDGAATTLSSYRGDVIVVNFWASWCAPCRKELPMLDAWNATWTGRGARVVAISIDTDAGAVRRFAKSENLSLPVFHDGPDGLARMLDIPSVPCTFLLDREGNVVRIVQSSSAEAMAALAKNVESLLASARGAAAQKAGVGPASAATTPQGAIDGESANGETP